MPVPVLFKPLTEPTVVLNTLPLISQLPAPPMVLFTPVVVDPMSTLPSNTTVRSEAVLSNDLPPLLLADELMVLATLVKVTVAA